MFAPIDLNESAKNSLRDAIKADVMAILNEEEVEVTETAEETAVEEPVNESNPCELGGGKPASNGGDTVKAPKTSKAKVVKGGSPAETAGDEEAFQDGGDGAAVEEDEKDVEKTEKKAGTKEEKKSEKTDSSEEEPETIDDIIKEIKDKDEELAKRLKDALKLDRKELKDEIKELKKDVKDAAAVDRAETDKGTDAVEETPAGDVVDEPEGGMEEITVDDVSVDEAESAGKYSVGSFLVDAKKIKDEDQKKPVEVAYEKDGKEYQKKVVDFRYREDGKGNGFLLAGDGKFVRLDRLAKYFATDEYVLERDDQIEFSEEGDDPKFRITGFDFEKNAFTAVRK